jgi:hypothetical protein
MKTQYQEDLRKWTNRQSIDQLAQKIAQEADACSLVDLEILCKEKGISVSDIRYYCPKFFSSVLEESRARAIQEVMLEAKQEKPLGSSLRELLRQKNFDYSLDRYSGKVSFDDIRECDPEWFDTAFGPRYFDHVPDIHEREDGNPPTFVKQLDKD